MMTHTKQQSENDSPSAIGSFFLDSGAHSIYTREVIAKEHKNGYAFYETDEFYAYVDSYAEFVKEHKHAIDFYANVDAIFNPEITWQVQQYLENEHGLDPVPVIHYGTDLKWVHHYLKRGHTLLGLGGLGQEATRSDYWGWAHKVYSILCPASNKYMPLVRTHGFAMTGFPLMVRFPWWSVDSASWIKSAAFGSIYVPHKRDGKFMFPHFEDTESQIMDSPYAISTSDRSPSRSDKGKHIMNLPPAVQRVLLEWLEQIGVPLGGYLDKRTGRLVARTKEEEQGVLNHHKPRVQANLLYFEAMSKSLPAWPWAYKPMTSVTHSLGIDWGSKGA